jgi:hypothetical protein
MASRGAQNFRLAVLNPGGRDCEQHFPDGAGDVGSEHPPTNFHAYSACTRGSFFCETKSALASEMSILLLIRGDFKASESALIALKKNGRKVAVSLKETGLHQIANQLRDRARLSRFLRIVRQADGCIASTPEAAEIYGAAGNGSSVFIPTPYPLDDSRWDFSQPLNQRHGIFVGTREWNVPSRNHLGALLIARQLCDLTAESVTVFNFDGRKGRELLSQLDFPAKQLRVLEKKIPYPEYLREIARHKIVVQLDTSFVPGQVAGDALLCRVPCIGGNGAVDRLAFPQTNSIGEIRELAGRLLRDRDFYREVVALAEQNKRLTFASVAAELENFFATL